MSAVKRLRALLAEKESIIVCPGVFDGLSARIALNAGFECLYMVMILAFRDDTSTK
jgi:2-methylisocitrate lyase-like PEP mutase family enzyme